MEKKQQNKQLGFSFVREYEMMVRCKSDKMKNLPFWEIITIITSATSQPRAN